MVIKLKLLVISDIHGDYKTFKNILEKEKYDEIVILGDLFSYTYDYNHNNEKIIDLLKNNKNKLILIKGNCDCFINYEANDLNAHDIINLNLNNYMVTLTHGHIYNKNNLPNNFGNIFISGHTHISCIQKEKKTIFLNPGSISIPRNNSKKSYLILDNNNIILKDINQNILEKVSL